MFGFIVFCFEFLVFCDKIKLSLQSIFSYWLIWKGKADQPRTENLNFKK